MKRNHSRSLLIAVGLLAFLMAACAPAAAPTTSSGDTGGPSNGLFGGQAAATEAPAVEEPEYALDADAGERAGAGGGSDSLPAAPPVSDGAGGGVSSSAGGDAYALPTTSAGEAAGGGPAVNAPDQQFSDKVTAGEIDDNEQFSEYLQYRVDYMRFNGSPVHDLDISERHAIRVMGQNGLPVLGADIEVYNGQDLVARLHTPATGIAYFFPRAYRGTEQAQSFIVTVRKDNSSQNFTLTRTQNAAVWDVRLNSFGTQPPVKLDVLFLIDSTGSMGDEIDQLKSNMLSISAQIAALPSRPDVRFAMVTYRDRGDTYIVRSADFTSDVQEFQVSLNDIEAGGGGDTPESLNEGLYNAISNSSWRGGDTVSMVILVADAAPHLDYEQDYDYAQEMVNAAALGIKINPIASSGTDDQAEYVFRQLAQFTGGHFIFLTYDDSPQSSGEPGTDLHVPEDNYTVKDLDALVVKLIADELAALNGQQ